jgi:hypothetical protein
MAGLVPAIHELGSPKPAWTFERTDSFVRAGLCDRAAAPDSSIEVAWMAGTSPDVHENLLA